MIITQNYLVGADQCRCPVAQCMTTGNEVTRCACCVHYLLGKRSGNTNLAPRSARGYRPLVNSHEFFSSDMEDFPMYEGYRKRFAETTIRDEPEEVCTKALQNILGGRSYMVNLCAGQKPLPDGVYVVLDPAKVE